MPCVPFCLDDRKETHILYIFSLFLSFLDAHILGYTVAQAKVSTINFSNVQGAL